jgi:hypothetical protein
MIKKGKYYRVRWGHTTSKGDQVESIVYRASEGLKELASLSELTLQTIPPDFFDSAVEVNEKELPLYIGWEYTSPKLAEIIKGIKNG